MPVHKPMLMRRCTLVQDAKHLRCYPLPDQRVEVVGHRGLRLAAANHCNQFLRLGTTKASAQST